jgi:anaerobic dimethyl sulfoxide reductase subunit C (anchor subunit)
MNIREWTLPVYTILTQLAIGALFIFWVIRTLSNQRYGKEFIDKFLRIPILIILFTVIFGLLAAHLHLSRPYLSFLALRNVQSSWLSRELAFNLAFIISLSCLFYIFWFTQNHDRLKTFLGWLTISFGFATDFCMSHIYLLASQPAWNSPLTVLSFFSTTMLLGVMTVPVLIIMDYRFTQEGLEGKRSIYNATIQRSLNWFAVSAIVLIITIAVLNYIQITTLRSGSVSAQTSVDLLIQLYRPLLFVRYILLIAGVIWLSMTLLFSQQKRRILEKLMAPAYMACLLVLIGEILGRFLFYAIHVRIGI